MQSIEDMINERMAKRTAILKATQKAGVGVVSKKDVEAIAEQGKQKPKPQPKPKPKPKPKTSSYRDGSVRVDTYES